MGGKIYEENGNKRNVRKVGRETEQDNQRRKQNEDEVEEEGK